LAASFISAFARTRRSARPRGGPPIWQVQWSRVQHAKALTGARKRNVILLWGAGVIEGVWNNTGLPKIACSGIVGDGDVTLAGLPDQFIE
jgi:hypothetical protein